MNSGKKEKISGGLAVLLQVFFTFFFLVFFVLLSLFPLKLYQWFLVIAIFSIVIRIYFIISDLYIKDDHLIIQKFLLRKKVPLKDCYRLDKSLFFPWLFYIEFNNRNKVFALLRVNLKSVFTPDQVVEKLREKIRRARS